MFRCYVSLFNYLTVIIIYLFIYRAACFLYFHLQILHSPAEILVYALMCTMSTKIGI